jgi:FHS family L-fucose permease-like MFS transporter
VSWLQGYISESIGIQSSYIVGVVCFAYLAFYAWKVSGILRSQGIDFDKPVSGGH